MLCHLPCDITHEFTPKINLKNFWPSQWSSLTDCLKSSYEPQKNLLRWEVQQTWICLQHQQLSIAFSRPYSRFVIREEKKISLMNCIWRFHIKSWSLDLLQGRQINLPDGLLHQPKLCIIFRYSSFFSQLLHCSQSLPKSSGTMKDSWKFSYRFLLWSQETTGSQSQNQSLF